MPGKRRAQGHCLSLGNFRERLHKEGHVWIGCEEWMKEVPSRKGHVRLKGMESHDGSGTGGGQCTRPLNILQKCLHFIVWTTKGNPQTFKWGSDTMLWVLTSLWLPRKAWSRSPQSLLSSFFIPCASSHSGSGTYEITFRGHGGWGCREIKRARKTTRGEKAGPGRPREDALTVLTGRKWKKQGAHYKQEHVYAFINISNVDLIFRVHPAYTEPDAFHLTSR